MAYALKWPTHAAKTSRLLGLFASGLIWRTWPFGACRSHPALSITMPIDVREIHDTYFFNFASTVPVLCRRKDGRGNKLSTLKVNFTAIPDWVDFRTISTQGTSTIRLFSVGKKQNYCRDICFILLSATNITNAYKRETLSSNFCLEPLLSTKVMMTSIGCSERDHI